MNTWTAEAIVTCAVADFVESATLVAVIEIVFGTGTAAGAVYRPRREIVPIVELPFVPLTVQVTAPLLLPVTEVVNCSVPPAGTLVEDGSMDICMDCAERMVME